MKSILLVQTSFLGDNILSTPVIRQLRQVYPEARLALLTTPAARPIYARNTLIDEIICYDKHKKQKGLLGTWSLIRKLKRRHFDTVFSLHRSARTSLILFLTGIPERIGFKNASFSFLYSKQRNRPKAVHEVERNLSLLGTPQSLKAIDITPPLEVELSGELRNRLPTFKKYVVIMPGSAWATKRWSSKGYAEVAAHFAAQGRSVLMLGAASEAADLSDLTARPDIINLLGATSLDETIYLISKADLVVCNDSMALHLASAFRRPTVAVFCATSPAFGFGPWENPLAEVVEKQDLSCKPCRRHGSNVCPTGTNACMLDLSSKNVIAAAEVVLKKAQEELQ